MKENNRGKNRLNNNEKKDKKFDKKPDSNLPFLPMESSSLDRLHTQK